MERNNNIPSEDEIRWTEFLNGESDAPDVSDLKRVKDFKKKIFQ